LFAWKLAKNGNIRISSTSKTKKIIAIKKNRKVNGIRALNLGENPHSNGLIFSRLKSNFLLNIDPASKTANTRILINKINEKYNEWFY